MNSSAPQQHHFPTARTVAAVAALLGATVLWAGNYVLGEYALAEVSPASLTTLRWAVSFIPLAALAAWIEKPQWQTVVQHWKWHVLQGIMGLSAYNLLLYGALSHTSALNASIINACNPALIAIGAAIVLGHRLSGLGILGIALALTGVLTVLSQADLHRLFTLNFGMGELLMTAAIVFFAAYTILGRIGPPSPPMTAVAAQSFVAAVFSAAIALPTGGIELPHSPSGCGAVLFIATLPSAGSYLLWNYGVAVLSPGRGGVFLNMITVFTAIMTVALGTPITVGQWVGGAVVIGGVIITTVPRRRPEQ